MGLLVVAFLKGLFGVSEVTATNVAFFVYFFSRLFIFMMLVRSMSTIKGWQDDVPYCGRRWFGWCLFLLVFRGFRRLLDVMRTKKKIFGGALT